MTDGYDDDYDDDYGGILKSGNTKNLHIWKDYQTRKVYGASMFCFPPYC